MSNAPLLRRAERGDLPQVIALIRGLAEFEKLPGPDDGGEIAGYAVYFMTYSTFQARPSLYLEDLYVRPDRRGRGTGAAFLRRLAGVAVERGCGRFEWTVLDWNVRAQKFYRSLGARMLAEWQLCRVEGDDIVRLQRG